MYLAVFCYLKTSNSIKIMYYTVSKPWVSAEINVNVIG
jgi:hypothetical protein